MKKHNISNEILCQMVCANEHEHGRNFRKLELGSVLVLTKQR